MVERNKRLFHYALNEGSQEVIVDGKHTGEFKQTYSMPIACFGNISPARGNALIERYGIALDYTHSIVLKDTAIQEDSILWIDIPTSEKFNARVIRKEVGLMSTTLYIQRL